MLNAYRKTHPWSPVMLSCLSQGIPLGKKGWCCGKANQVNSENLACLHVYEKMVRKELQENGASFANVQHLLLLSINTKQFCVIIWNIQKKQQSFAISAPFHELLLRFCTYPSTFTSYFVSCSGQTL